MKCEFLLPSLWSVFVLFPIERYLTQGKSKEIERFITIFYKRTNLTSVAEIMFFFTETSYIRFNSGIKKY
jgi:hypothetical protein